MFFNATASIFELVAVFDGYMSCVDDYQIEYENVFLASDSGTLEQLKEMSSKRRAMEESINEKSLVTAAIAREMSGGLTSRCQQVNYFWYHMLQFYAQQ